MGTRADVSKALVRLERLERDRNIIGLIRELDSQLEWRLLTVAGQAAKALGRIGDARATQHIVPLVRHPSSGVRFDAIVALGYLGDADAVPFLISALRDASATNQEAAARSLGHLRSTDASQPLRVAARSDDGMVRIAAAEALAAIGDDSLADVVHSGIARERWWKVGSHLRKGRWRRLVAQVAEAKR